MHITTMIMFEFLEIFANKTSVHRRNYVLYLNIVLDILQTMVDKVIVYVFTSVYRLSI